MLDGKHQVIIKGSKGGNDDMRIAGVISQAIPWLTNLR